MSIKRREIPHYQILRFGQYYRSSAIPIFDFETETMEMVDVDTQTSSDPPKGVNTETETHYSLSSALVQAQTNISSC